MIISHGREYIFVHIPKTGGTSVALALEARAMKDDILLGDTPKARKRRHRVKDVKSAGRLWKHATLADAEGLITRPQMQHYFTFTLVRNPWDRMVSYYHWLQDQQFDHPAVALAKKLGFQDFVKHPQTAQAFRASPYQSYMCDGAGKVHCNAFIRLEHFNEDAQPLFDHLGFSLSLPVVNQSSRQGDYRSYYSDIDAESVGVICAQDIARFGYKFD